MTASNLKRYCFSASSQPFAAGNLGSIYARHWHWRGDLLKCCASLKHSIRILHISPPKTIVRMTFRPLIRMAPDLHSLWYLYVNDSLAWPQKCIFLLNVFQSYIKQEFWCLYVDERDKGKRGNSNIAVDPVDWRSVSVLFSRTFKRLALWNRLCGFNFMCSLWWWQMCYFTQNSLAVLSYYNRVNAHHDNAADTQWGSFFRWTESGRNHVDCRITAVDVD